MCWISVCRHAIVITPVGSVVHVASPALRAGLIPTDGGLPRPISGSAPTLNFSRTAQRSLALRPACSLDRHAAHLSRRLRRFCCLHRRSDSYRLERPTCRAGIAPAEDPHLSTAHNWVRSSRFQPCLPRVRAIRSTPVRGRGFPSCLGLSLGLFIVFTIAETRCKLHSRSLLCRLKFGFVRRVFALLKLRPAFFPSRHACMIPAIPGSSPPPRV